MVRFTVSRQIRASAVETWQTLVDWPRHGHWAPLTVVTVTTARPDGAGAGFVARTGIGRLAFDDPMTVVQWQPPAGNHPHERPGRCMVQKHGTVIRGRAWFTVEPAGENQCRVVWDEDISVWPHRMTRLTGPLLSAAGRAAFSATLRAMAHDVEHPATS
jgi:hypothetical protein